MYALVHDVATNSAQGLFWRGVQLGICHFPPSTRCGRQQNQKQCSSETGLQDNDLSQATFPLLVSERRLHYTMKDAPRKVYSLFQPLKLRPVQQAEENPDSDSEDGDDDDIPLAFLAPAKQTPIHPCTAMAKRSRQGENQRQQQKKLRKQSPNVNPKASAPIAPRPLNQSTLSFHSKAKETEQHYEKQQIAGTHAEEQSQEQRHGLVPSPGDPLQQLAIDNLNSTKDQMDDIKPESSESGSDEKPPDDKKEVAVPIGENQSTTKRSSPARNALRRIVSKESAIEFIPDAKKPKDASLLKQLVERSCRGTSITSQVSQPKRWKSPSWVGLLHTRNSVEPTRPIDHLAWDKMGVLFAVASDKWISVYDWDMVRAADIHGKNDRMRQIKDSTFKIPPILKFRVPNPVASLEWNPHNDDQLAIGFR